MTKVHHVSYLHMSFFACMTGESVTTQSKLLLILHLQYGLRIKSFKEIMSLGSLNLLFFFFLEVTFSHFPLELKAKNSLENVSWIFYVFLWFQGLGHQPVHTLQMPREVSNTELTRHKTQLEPRVKSKNA